MNIFDYIKSFFVKECSKPQAFSKKEEIIEKIEDETLDMSVSEYNQYIEDKREKKYQEILKRLENDILPNAWQEHINECKRQRKKISPSFFLDDKNCNLSSDEMRNFYTETVIGNFSIHCTNYSHSPGCFILVSVLNM